MQVLALCHGSGLGGFLLPFYWIDEITELSMLRWRNAVWDKYAFYYLHIKPNQL